jgi:preprotein translocase subunit SecF
MRIFHKTNFDFIKFRKIAYGFSLVILASGLISLAVKGLNYGIDFRGGSEVLIRFEKNIDVSTVRSVLDQAGISGSLKQYGLDRSFLFSTVFNGETNDLKSLVSHAFDARLKANPHEIVRIDAVGPSIASDLKWSAMKALLAALVAILLYVGIRFEIKFATAGVIAIFHDILSVLGLFSILGGLFEFMPLEMDQSIIAAFLTIAGYSITDTVESGRESEGRNHRSMNGFSMKA